MIKIFGIETRIHLSTLVLAVLIFMSGLGIARETCPQCPQAIINIISFVMVLFFIISIFIHELAHCKVGALFNVEFKSITIFALGGMARMTTQPPTAKSEFFMALAGPLSSVAVGVFFYIIVYFILPTPTLGGNNYYIYALSSLLFIAYINVMLGIYNMIPAFPLDGGKVLRAIIWQFSNKFIATMIAGIIGAIIGILLVAACVLMIFEFTIPILGTGTINGIWIGLMGYFIYKLSVEEIKRTRNEKANSI
jgi:Zn-dependent protease